MNSYKYIDFCSLLASIFQRSVWLIDLLIKPFIHWVCLKYNLYTTNYAKVLFWDGPVTCNEPEHRKTMGVKKNISKFVGDLNFTIHRKYCINRNRKYQVDSYKYMNYWTKSMHYWKKKKITCLLKTIIHNCKYKHTITNTI